MPRSILPTWREGWTKSPNGLQPREFIIDYELPIIAMKFAHILASFYFQPWSIMPEKHAAMGQILQRHLSGVGIANVPPMRND